ncbi:MAG: preprotein translocase subunit SecG [Methylibium sp.]|uniref:preprotein translocase subunit SecG n=1 Tax=Methylibium sp. TaxID=2067992 RepID=UPI00180D8BD5|nr:preprotein translocase subunit SecG [Methylibium sp.]MBA3589730.1 preprotein translocase subunit SecG [Methylibium sp.]MBA3624506.1 preprotein translocase subunit SecG [Methylibium sp.]
MQLVLTIVVVMQMLTALVMIGLVLIQHGKGADMGASFGSGASGSLFGATGSANFLSRSTAVCAALFFCCTLALAYFGNLPGVVGGSQGGSILERAAPGGAGASIPGAGIPGVAPSDVPTPAAPASAEPAVPASAASGAAQIPTR